MVPLPGTVGGSRAARRALRRLPDLHEHRFYQAFVVANNVVLQDDEGLPSARVRR